MSAQIIDGRAVAAKITERSRAELARLGFAPGLAAILVGDDPASRLYVGLKEKACAKLGLRFEKHLFPKDAQPAAVLAKLAELNARDDVDGILVQLPLPPQFDENAVINAIEPAKDADGFHFENLSLLLMDSPRLVPGLVAGVMELLKATGEPLKDRRALVIARSRVFIAPLDKLLHDAGAKPEYVRPDYDDLAVLLREADIVIVAAGQPKLITGGKIKPGATVIDIGTNQVDGRPVGDADFESVKEVAGWLTPVPGGVGPVTVAMLLASVIRLAGQRRLAVQHS